MMKFHASTGHAAVATLAIPLCGSLIAVEFEVTRSTIDGSGDVMRSAGGEFELSGTIGKPTISRGPARF